MLLGTIMMMSNSTDKILLIEDEADLAEVLQFIFEDLGINIDVALSCSKAREMLAENNYQMVISDMRLPDGSGAEICKEYHKKCPFILYSGFSDLSKQEALEIGALMILSKPLNLEELGTLIKTFLDGEINEEQFLAELA